MRSYLSKSWCSHSVRQMMEGPQFFSDIAKLCTGVDVTTIQAKIIVVTTSAVIAKKTTSSKSSYFGEEDSYRSHGWPQVQEMARCKLYKINATSSRPQQKHVQHHQEQVTSTMIPYLSMQRMLQSLWRRGQQQWRDDYCSHVQLLPAATQFLWTLHASLACQSIIHEFFESRRAGARQFFNMYNCTQDIRENADSKQQNFHANMVTKKHNITSPHQQPWAVPKQQQCQWRLPNNLAIIATITYKGPMEAWWNPQQLWKLLSAADSHRHPALA